jgi:hypothetical protein
VTTSPELTAKERKRKIMSHLSMSSEDFGEITSTNPQEKRKRQINEHLRQSQG